MFWRHSRRWEAWRIDSKSFQKCHLLFRLFCRNWHFWGAICWVIFWLNNLNGKCWSNKIMNWLLNLQVSCNQCLWKYYQCFESNSCFDYYFHKLVRSPESFATFIEGEDLTCERSKWIMGQMVLAQEVQVRPMVRARQKWSFGVENVGLKDWIWSVKIIWSSYISFEV
jgi:hypothetical protein